MVSQEDTISLIMLNLDKMDSLKEITATKINKSVLLKLI